MLAERAAGNIESSRGDSNKINESLDTLFKHYLMKRDDLYPPLICLRGGLGRISKNNKLTF